MQGQEREIRKATQYRMCDCPSLSDKAQELKNLMTIIQSTQGLMGGGGGEVVRQLSRRKTEGSQHQAHTPRTWDISKKYSLELY